MTPTEPKRPAGYRGALPPREDRLARPWLIIVIGFFVLIMVLSMLGIPSRLIPEPTPIPLPTLPASGSPAPAASPLPSESPSPTATAE